MEVKKKYSVKELSMLLGCSVTAVQKKIFVDVNNPSIKRYKKRYEVVIEDGKSVILLSDSELEEEKRLSKGFNNVQTNVGETSENVIDVDYTAETAQIKENSIDKILEFTERYMERFEQLQKGYYNLLTEKEHQVKLLTDSENKTNNKFFEMSAKCKELEERNKFLKRLLYVLTGVLIFLVTLYFLVVKPF